MLRKITYFTTDKKKPNDLELDYCIKYANEHPDEKVVLEWKGWSMTYRVCFDDVNTIEEARAKMPKYDWV